MMMSKIIYNSDSMKFMSSFEMITRSRVKDLIIHNDILFFIVQPGEIRKAVGPKGANVRKLEKILKKKNY